VGSGAVLFAREGFEVARADILWRHRKQNHTGNDSVRA
jgi:hypothetical protein